MNQLVNQVIGILAGLVLLVSSSVSALPSKIHDFTSKFAYNPNKTAKSVNEPGTQSAPKPSVLAAVVDRTVTGVSFTIPAFFKDLVKIDTTLEVGGKSTFVGDITAPNVVYSLTAGDNITITGTQDLTISATNSGVTSLGGSTGSLSLAAGSGITVSGLTITNSDKGSSQSIFKTISVSGQSDISASSNTDVLTFVAGTGILVTTDATNKKVTITGNSDPGWTDDGTTVRLSTSTDSVGVGTVSPSSKIHLVGGDLRLGTGTFDNPSSDEDLYVTGNIELDGTFYGNISSGTINPGLTTGSVIFQGSSGITGDPSQFFWNDTTNRLGIGTSSPTSTLHVTGTGAFSGALTAASLDLGGGGITNAGPITGATGFTSTGTITFGSLTTGIAHLSSGGVLSSSAVDIASADITGTLATTSGGTGLTAYSTGDILYGSATNVLSRLGVGSSGQVLSVSGGIPSWASITGGSGGLCTNCLVSDPGSTQTIAPTGSSTTGLAIKQTSTGGGSADIFKVTSSDGATAYLRVDSTGNVVLGTGSATGVFTVNPASTDPISISPVAQGAGAFTGTLTSNDLTDARTWTLPNATGSICLDTGNCAGSGSNLGGSGTANYLTRWNAQYTLENGSIYDNGDIGIGTTAPAANFDTVGTAWLRGSSSTTGLYVESSGNVGIGTTNPSYALDVVGTGNISGATTLGNTLNVTGATTLSSTLDVTSHVTSGGSLKVNGTGDSWIMGSVGIGTSSPGAKLEISTNSISTGKGLYVTSTSTSFSSGLLAAIDWSPSSSTTATGDILSVNVGANGIVGNIFNVKNNGSSVFSVSQSAITAGLPTSFTAAGDVSIAYDLLFSNQTSGNIKSLGPLAIEAGESFESNYLTLRTFNSGQLFLDLAGGLTLGQAQNWTLATATNALNFGGVLDIDSTNTRIGIGTTAPGGTIGFGSAATVDLASSTTGLNIESGLLNLDSTNTRVGIGTTAPDARLHVSGGDSYFAADSGYTFDNPSASADVYVEGNLEVDGTIYGNISGSTINPGQTTGSVLFQGASGIAADASNFFWDDSTNRLGIGTSTPQLPLHIVGNGTHTATFMNGSVGIGTTSPTAALTVGAGSGALADGADDVLIAGDLEVDDDLRIDGGAVTLGAATNFDLAASATALSFETDLLNLDTTNDGVDITTAATTTDAFDLTADSLTQGIGMDISVDALTTGYGLSITSTSTALSTGRLLSLDWSPGSSTTATGDMLSINVGANGVVGNIFNVKNAGTSVFSVSQSAITAGLPTSFTAAGDVNIAYDLNFTNQTASYIKSNAPLYIEAGETFESNDLTLRTYNSGDLVFDLAGGATFAQAQYWDLASSTSALNFDNFFNIDTTNSRIGIGTTTPSATIDFGSAATVNLAASTTGLNIESGLLNLDSTNTRVGIGTTAPDARLHVAGGDSYFAANSGYTFDNASANEDVYVQGNLEVDGTIYGNVSGSTVTATGLTQGSVVFAGSGGALSQDNTNFFWDDSNNRLGLGTTAPGGTIGFGSAATIDLASSTTGLNIESGLLNLDTSLLRVGIGTTAPGYTLDVKSLVTDIARFNGPASTGCTLSDGGVIACSSDENLKKNIGNLSYGLTEVLKLRATEFNWKSETDGTSKSLGFIAQEVEGILPKLVTADKITGYKQLNTVGMVPVLVKSIQELAQTDIQLKEEINRMVSLIPTEASGEGSSEVDPSVVALLQDDVTNIQGTVLGLSDDTTGLKDKVASLEARLALLESSPVSPGDSSVILSDSEGSSEAIIASSSAVLGEADELLGKETQFDQLTVTGLSKLTDLNVIGDATFGFLEITGMDLAGGSNIDTITGPLRLQSTAQNDLEIMNGKVLVSKEGNIVTTGEITAKKLNILGETDALDKSVGQSTLLKGTKKLTVLTTAVTEKSHVFVTPRTLLDYPLVVTVVKPQEGFTVEIKSSEDKDVEFDWFIVN